MKFSFQIWAPEVPVLSLVHFCISWSRLYYVGSDGRIRKTLQEIKGLKTEIRLYQGSICMGNRHLINLDWWLLKRLLRAVSCPVLLSPASRSFSKDTCHCLSFLLIFALNPSCSLSPSLVPRLSAFLSVPTPSCSLPIGLFSWSHLLAPTFFFLLVSCHWRYMMLEI